MSLRKLACFASFFLPPSVIAHANVPSPGAGEASSLPPPGSSGSEANAAPSEEDVVSPPGDSPQHADEDVYDNNAILLKLEQQGFHYDEENGRIIAPLYGNIRELMYYIVDIEVGNPPQRVSVIVDSGSTLLGFACVEGTEMGENLGTQHVDPLFNVTRSATFEWIPTGPKCAAVHGYSKGQYCTYSQGYDEGSRIAGKFGLDEVRFGEIGEDNPPVKFPVGCHNEETKLFKTQKANGILGLGPSPYGGRETILDEIFNHAKYNYVDRNTFSMCLSDEGGELVIGKYYDKRHISKDPEDIVWTKMVTHGVQYYIPAHTLMVQDTKNMTTPSWSRSLGEPRDFGHAFVDSGTTYTYLPGDLYKMVSDYILELFKFKGLEKVEVKGQKACAKFASKEEMSEILPTMKFMVAGVDSREAFVHGRWNGQARESELEAINWIPAAYMFEKFGLDGVYCLAVGDNGGDNRSILGASFMKHINFIHDLKHDRLGLAPAECPTVEKRPRTEEEEAEYRKQLQARKVRKQEAPTSTGPFATRAVKEELQVVKAAATASAADTGNSWAWTGSDYFFACLGLMVVLMCAGLLYYRRRASYVSLREPEEIGRVSVVEELYPDPQLQTSIGTPHVFLTDSDEEIDIELARE